jgi:hypothetical protein
MWETWEAREGEIDLAACRQRGILVLGTHEERVPHSMYPYCGFTALKLLFELGVEGYRTRLALLGSGILARSIHDIFTRLEIRTDWFGDGDGPPQRYGDLAAFWREHGSLCDVLLLADQHSRSLGSKPVLELYAAGLKVGEAMARARLSGLSVDAARAVALRASPAMDFFPGNDALSLEP